MMLHAVPIAIDDPCLDSIGDPIQTLDYVYDVLDRRIGKTDTPAVGPGYTERYVYDGEHLALKFGASALANRYLHGPVIDQILADEQVSSLSSPGDVLWPLVDKLGTVRDLAEHDSGTDNTVIVNHISYHAFGGITAESNAAVDHLFGYTGRREENGTGVISSQLPPSHFLHISSSMHQRSMRCRHWK